MYRDDLGITWTDGSSPRGASKASRGGRTLWPHEDAGLLTQLLQQQDPIPRAWMMTVLAVACVGVVGALFVGVYVCVRVCDGSVGGPGGLGALLLVGVGGLYASCAVYVLPVGQRLGCAVRLWLPALALALCYAALLAKLLYLHALRGPSPSAQGRLTGTLSLYVCVALGVGVQVALLLSTGRLDDQLGAWDGPAAAAAAAAGQTPLMASCPSPAIASDALYYYPTSLLCLSLLVGLAAYSRKGAKEANYGEGRWLLLAAGVSLAVAAAWLAVRHLAPPAMEPPTTTVALLALASILLCLVFGPKLRLLLRQARQFSHDAMPASASPRHAAAAAASPRHALASPHTASVSTVFSRLDLPIVPALTTTSSSSCLARLYMLSQRSHTKCVVNRASLA